MILARVFFLTLIVCVAVNVTAYRFFRRRQDPRQDPRHRRVLRTRLHGELMNRRRHIKNMLEDPRARGLVDLKLIDWNNPNKTPKFLPPDLRSESQPSTPLKFRTGKTDPDKPMPIITDRTPKSRLTNAEPVIPHTTQVFASTKPKLIAPNTTEETRELISDKSKPISSHANNKTPEFSMVQNPINANEVTQKTQPNNTEPISLHNT